MPTTPLKELPQHHLVERISASELDQHINRLVSVVGDEVAGQEITLLSIFFGAEWFASQFRAKLENLPNPPSLIREDHFRVSSYEKGMVTNGKPKVVEYLNDPEENVTNKNVLLLEDIIDSGLTVATAALPYVLKWKPARLRVIAMLTKFANLKVDKDDLRLMDSGPNIGYFAVGSRLDWEGNYRDLSGIHEVVKEKQLT